jgi:hypothetical protein
MNKHEWLMRPTDWQNGEHADLSPATPAQIRSTKVRSDALYRKHLGKPPPPGWPVSDADVILAQRLELLG